MSTDVITNSEKHENYREQMSRLTKAMKSQFYLEAVFIEYAVIEDRLTSILRYTNDFNAEKHNTIVKKLNKLESIQRDKNGILKNYISDELISEIHEWKNNRNTIVHALLNQTVSTDELKTFAEKGQELAKTLSSKATSYKRYLERNPVVDKTLTADQKKIYTEITDKGVLKKINAEYVTKNNITELVIPDFVKKLADGVFDGLTTVKSLKVGMLLNNFGYRNLSKLWQLEEISVHEKNRKFVSVDGVLYEKNKKEMTLCLYPPQKWCEENKDKFVIEDEHLVAYNGTDNHIIIPNNVKVIDGEALGDNEHIESIAIPESVVEIDHVRIFKERDNIVEIHLPSKEVFYRFFNIDFFDDGESVGIDFYIDDVCYESDDKYDMEKLFPEVEEYRKVVIDYNEIAEYYEDYKKEWLEEIKEKKS